MTYTELDHKKMWVEKLDKDLEQIHALGIIIQMYIKTV